MFAASKSGSVDAKDPQFNYVTMLLHGNGTNGAQNNTFVDSSTNNFTITRNGNTTQGTFTPYGSNWSNYFDGSSSLSISSANTVLPTGTQDFSVELFVNWQTQSGSYPQIISNPTTNGFQIYYDVSAGALAVGIFNVANVITYTIAQSTLTGAWTHIAVTRSGNTFRLFVNGVLQSNGTNTISFASPTTQYIASDGSRPYTGYISNVRTVLGSIPTAYQTSSTTNGTSVFTPSTTPLTAVSGTALLTCQSNRFIDNSTNAFALTANGSPSVQRFSPFSPTTAYSTSVIGGSGYFDGSGDYLTTPQNTAFNFGTGAFTVEAWVYITASNGTNQRIIGLGDGAIGGGPYTGWQLSIQNNLTTIDWYRYDGTETDLSASYTFKTNTWYHIVAVRNGSSNLSMYVNGTRVYNNASASLSYNNVNTNPLYVGLTYDGAGGGGNKFFNGYMNDARIVAGSAVYDPTSSTLTVPTAPLTAITNTSLLLSYTNAGILDNAIMNDLETVGNAQISTSVKKYGTGSMYFDGTGDYLTAPVNSQSFNLGSGDFTVEFWVYTNSSGSNQDIVCLNPNSNQSSYATLRIVIESSTFKYYLSTAGTTWNYSGGSASVTGSTWYHVALVRNGSTVTFYINGTSNATSSVSTNSLYFGDAQTRIGNLLWSGGNQYLNGYIDDLRITKGVARYTTTFTPPTAAFADKG